MSDWSKLASSVFSQASDILTEAKQRVQTISQEDLDPQNIDWSKVSSDVVSRASDALTEAKQRVNQAASQRDIDLQDVDWSKLSANVVSRASDALRDAKQLVRSNGNLDMFRNLWTKFWGSILSSGLFALTEVNNWSIRHPYKSAGALLLIAAFENPAMSLTLLRLAGTTLWTLCFLPVRLIIWHLGFGSRGVEKGSFASQYQSCRYDGNVPRGSDFAKLQSYGATMPTATSTLVSSLSYAGAAIVLGREWGWWLQ
ncbi:hypothetical protein DFJ58DRAFT_894232 [Suillus subalutaceus]|uniref:uncharacterized protein n=1 Tax=Suillus subalutaceus TaxID=48586 RepID=UPI001B861A46|nr:uncharacterized protein DFJ58DRAFT_894232 [Suillus subalutaceus]KAG1844960.1 hypothetical protein DFJ58DRAFT_894232 [Suillus subalutaceus]